MCNTRSCYATLWSEGAGLRVCVGSKVLKLWACRCVRGFGWEPASVLDSWYDQVRLVTVRPRCCRKPVCVFDLSPSAALILQPLSICLREVAMVTPTQNWILECIWKWIPPKQTVRLFMKEAASELREGGWLLSRIQMNFYKCVELAGGWRCVSVCKHQLVYNRRNIYYCHIWKNDLNASFSAKSAGGRTAADAFLHASLFALVKFRTTTLHTDDFTAVKRHEPCTQLSRHQDWDQCFKLRSKETFMEVNSWS